MGKRTIHCGPIRGTVTVPASKSVTHRLYIIAALSRKAVTIHHPLVSDDTEITLAALGKYGYDFRISAESVSFTGRMGIVDEPVNLEVGNSGTSARLLTAFAAIHALETRIDGSQRMRERPMRVLIEALQRLGVIIEHRNGYLPLRISGGDIQGASVEVDASQSSQFLSALLLVAPNTDTGLTLIHGGRIASSAYVDTTLALMRKAGIGVRSNRDSFQVPGSQQYQLQDCEVEGDFSSAAYFLTAAAITAGEVTIRNLPQKSLQGDRIIIEILQDAGAIVRSDQNGLYLRGDELQGIDYNMYSYPDLVPTVAVMALFANGSSILRNVAHLRYKESDRIRSIIENTARLNGKAYMKGADLIIEPRPLRGNVSLPAYGDHRIAMSFALSGLRLPGVAIENPECVKKSYPDFWRHLDNLIIREFHT